MRINLEAMEGRVLPDVRLRFDSRTEIKHFLSESLAAGHKITGDVLLEIGDDPTPKITVATKERTIEEAIDRFVLRVLRGDCTPQETEILRDVLDCSRFMNAKKEG